MKVLIIGSNNFLIREFINISFNDFELIVLNSDNVLINLPNVKHILMDRHSYNLNQLKEEFDVIVDFGAYKKNDIKFILDNIKTNKYIFLSTSEVYERNSFIKTEESLFNYNNSFYSNSDYINNKIILEEELINESLKHNIEYVSIRPNYIYGPNNYINRENLIFEYIVKYNTLLIPSDSNSWFELVYVSDVAKAIKLLINSNLHHAYNISSNELINYKRLSQMLKRITNINFNEISTSYSNFIEMGFSFPYPVFKEDELLTNSMLFNDEFKFKYTSLEDGFTKTYKAFK